VYKVKNEGIPEYYLGGNVELLGDLWKNQGLGLDILPRTNIRKFETIFGKASKPIKISSSEGYHPEVDNKPLCPDED
jgi:hypothetical protein